MSDCSGCQAIPPLPEGQADGVRPTRSTLHPTGPGDPSQGGNGYQTHMRFKGWEAARQGKKFIASDDFWVKYPNLPKLFPRLSHYLIRTLLQISK